MMPARDFATVYDEHVWQVYGFFAYRMRDRADAEDLTQQTFERALKSWSRYDPSRAGVGTWLIVIARNLLIDHARADRSSRRQPLDDLDSSHDALVATGTAPDLERALAHLGPRDREIIALRFGGDLSGPEIAKVTGLSLANVQQILSRSTVSAVESAFNTLAHTVLSNNARTLEDLVKEMLRPMLKSWLDDNLPGLVERIVKAEIERVSRGR